MDFGSLIDKKIQNDPTFCPSLPRYPHMQYQLDVVYNKKIYMTGKPDGLCLEKFYLADYKTGRNPWKKADADKTDQLTCYLFLIYISKKIQPEKFHCYIHWLPTTKMESGSFDVKIQFRDNPVVPITFETKRNMGDLLKFGDKVQQTVEDMQKVNDLILLSEHERDILVRRAKGETLEKIGNSYGVTRERIRQVEAKGNEKIRQASKKFLEEKNRPASLKTAVDR